MYFARAEALTNVINMLFAHNDFIPFAFFFAPSSMKWGGDGGAEETTYGIYCLDNFLASPSGMNISPDLM